MNSQWLFQFVCLFVLFTSLSNLTGCLSTKQSTAQVSFLEKNPALRKQLLQWEQDAPESLKREIRLIRTGEEGYKGNHSTLNSPAAKSRVALTVAGAANRLREMKGDRKGAILALVDIALRNSTPLKWVNSKDAGKSVALGTATSPASEVALTLGEMGEPAVEPLIGVL